MLEGCKGSLQYRYGRYKELKQVPKPSTQYPKS